MVIPAAGEYQGQSISDLALSRNLLRHYLEIDKTFSQHDIIVNPMKGDGGYPYSWWSLILTIFLGIESLGGGGGDWLLKCQFLALV